MIQYAVRNKIGTQYFEIVCRTDKRDVVAAVHDIVRERIVHIELSKPLYGQSPQSKLIVIILAKQACHNGLKNITEILGNSDYARLRFGIGSDFPKGSQIDYVLGEWTSEEEEKLHERINYAIEAIKSFAAIGCERTMNFFNKK